MSDYIPLEIQSEILKRLPLKPLIQFRSVSKSWKCLIDSPDFKVSYGVHHPQPTGRFILRYLREPNYLTLVDKEGDLSFVQQEFIPTIPDLVKVSDGYNLSVVGSSHGLLCFEGFYYKCLDGPSIIGMVRLWNPSVRKSVGIPVPNILDSMDKSSHCVAALDFIGFGVCPITFDPVILNICCLVYEHKMEDRVPWKVQVFTLSTGTWSILSTNLPGEAVVLDRFQVVIGRFIYWAASYKLDAEDGKSQLHRLIMSFDLTTKEFKEINLPDSLRTKVYCDITAISKLHESLVFLEHHREFERDPLVCSLWMMMMKDDGVNRSFTKLYNINVLDATITTLLGSTETGELILETNQPYKRKAELAIYKPNSEAIDKLGIDGDYCSFFVCPYMETLLLLDHLDGFIYSISN